jgi:hypothetical protein
VSWHVVLPSKWLPPLGDYQTEAAALPGAPDHHWNLLQSMLNPW